MPLPIFPTQAARMRRPLHAHISTTTAADRRRRGAMLVRKLLRRALRPGAWAPAAVLLLMAALMLAHGPIGQLANYHDFADQRALAGLPHAADVASNLGFAVVGAAGLALLWRRRTSAALRDGMPGYVLFFGAVLLTAFGSSWYHLAPDNARLVWDRLPIALACAGLLAALWRQHLGAPAWLTPVLALAASASVAWWRYTSLLGADDLRPYLLLQLAPLILIPLVQWQYRAARAERLAFGGAVGLYLLAKLCELADHRILDALGGLSGHSLKHILASAAAALVLAGVAQRQGGTGEALAH